MPNEDNDSQSSTIDPADVVSPAGAGIKIYNVNQSLWQYVIKRRLFELVAFVPLVIVWEILAIVLFVKVLGAHQSNSNGLGKGAGFIIALPFIIFFGWLDRLRKQFEDAFLEEFAKVNHYNFVKDGTVDETYGTIFRLSGRQQISDVVTGTYGDNGLRLFLYELTDGSGRSQHTYHDTVIELDLHGQLPNLLMANKHSKYTQLGIAGGFGIKNTLQLEGDFNQYFTLYAPPGNEIEALEVFSPDTMALMEDASKHFSVELAGNRIYIYSNGLITTTEQLTGAFTLAKKLIDKLAPLAMQLQHDSAIVPAPANLQIQRKRLLLSNKFGLAFVFAVTFIGISMVVYAIIIASNQSNTNGTASNQSINSPMSSSLSASAFPNCGVVAHASMPQATQQYINLIVAQNKQLGTISSEIKADNYLATNAIIDRMVAINRQYVTALQAINFPSSVQPFVVNEITAIQNYNTTITQEETTTVSDVALNNARSAQSTATKKLRTSLGLPLSTCGAYIP